MNIAQILITVFIFCGIGILAAGLIGSFFLIRTLLLVLVFLAWGVLISKKKKMDDIF